MVSPSPSPELLKLLKFLSQVGLPLFNNALEVVGALPLLRIKDVTGVENGTSESNA